MPLASEVTTWQEPLALTNGEGRTVLRLRSRVRTNAGQGRLKRRLETLGLLALAESVEKYEAGWHWSGTGHGYEILWRETVGFSDILAMARL